MGNSLGIKITAATAIATATAITTMTAARAALQGWVDWLAWVGGTPIGNRMTVAGNCMSHFCLHAKNSKFKLKGWQRGEEGGVQGSVRGGGGIPLAVDVQISRLKLCFLS